MSSSVSYTIVLLDIEINRRLYSVAISSTRLHDKHNYKWEDMEGYRDNSFSLILREEYEHSNRKGDWEMVKGVYKDTVGEIVVDDDDLTIKDSPIEHVVLLNGDLSTTKDEVDSTFSKDQTIGISDQDMNKDELAGVSDESTSDTEEASEGGNEKDVENDVSIENDVVVHEEVPVVIEDHKEDLEAIPKESFDEATIESHSEDGSKVPNEHVIDLPIENGSEAPNEDVIIVHSEDGCEIATESPIESPNEDSSEAPNEDGCEIATESPIESPSEHTSEQASEDVSQFEVGFYLESDIPSEMNDELSSQLIDSNSDCHAEIYDFFGSSKAFSVNDNLSMIPQASLHSVCGESVITCDTGYNDIDSIPAAVNDYSDSSFDMAVSDMNAEDPITSEPTHIVDSNSKPFRLISANALLESEFDDDQLSPTTNSLSIEDSSDEELKQYLIKNSPKPKPKPYRCHRSRSPPRNNPPRMNSPIKEPAKPERLIPHQLLNGHSKPKPIARPVVQSSSVGYHDTVPDTKPVNSITPMPSSSFTTPSETKHSFQFAEDLYSRLNMKLSMIGQSLNNDPVESSFSSLSSTSSTSSVSSTSSFTLSSSSSVSDENPKPVSGGVRRTTVSHYEPLLENASLIDSLTLSDYIPSKKSSSLKTVTKKVTPEITPVKEDCDDGQDLILSEEEQLLLHNPEKKLELMVYSNRFESSCRYQLIVWKCSVVFIIKLVG